MKNLQIRRHENGLDAVVRDALAEELVLHVDLGEGVGFDTVISPGMLRDFVYGNLFSEGLITSPADITFYRQERRGAMAGVQVRIKGLEGRLPFLKRNYGIIWADCGRKAPEYRRVGERLVRRAKGFMLEPAVVLKVLSSTASMFSEFERTGGYHYAFLLDRDANVIGRAPDVSRHNAVDKVIGQEFLAGRPLDDRVLFVTGRIGMDIAMKCIRCRIPLVVSRSAPLYQAVMLARKYNLGMIGFLRGKRFNIYSGYDIFG
jgi:FdhD protein